MESELKVVLLAGAAQRCAVWCAETLSGGDDGADSGRYEPVVTHAPNLQPC